MTLRSHLLLALIALPLGAAPAAAGPPEPTAMKWEADAQPRIVNGVTTFDYSSVAAIVSGSGQILCSATVIGCNTVLTAAHCVCGTVGTACQPGGIALRNPTTIDVFLQHGGLFGVADIAVPLDYDFGVTSDVAVLTLSETVTGLAPSALNTVSDPGFSLTGTLVGFGRTGATNDYGMKRTGRVVTAACSAVPVPEPPHVCWLFESPVGAAGEDSNTCNGDSGGPLFLDFGAGELLAGVTSGGNQTNCLADDQSFDANVWHQQAFIQTAAGSDLGTASCGPFAPVGKGATTLAWEETLPATVTQLQFPIVVPPGTDELRVVLNGVDSADFDLLVKQGSAPVDWMDADCPSVTPPFGPFEACIFDAPASDTYYAVVENPFADPGPFQLSVTLLREGLFVDGFESGATASWSSTTP